MLLTNDGHIAQALLEGFEWDARGRRYDTIDELYDYCARVAGTVGAMMALVVGAILVTADHGSPTVSKILGTIAVMFATINIVAGFLIGVLQNGMEWSRALSTYTVLTIGDGLVAQIPSLFLSLATAIIVTRVTTSESISEQASVQLANPTALFISAVILLILGMVPGMPHLMFIALALASAGFRSTSCRIFPIARRR